MTGEEWLACTDPDAMLDSLWYGLDARKKHLFAAACFLGTFEDGDLILGNRSATGMRSDGLFCVVAKDVRNGTERGARVTPARAVALLRDVVGDPSHPATFDDLWRTRDVISLAEAIYLDRRFDELSVLADALEDANCTDADVLNHLRSPGPHVRGCWALDLILGKS